MKISFDFDGTLSDEFDGSVNEQKEEIQKICKDYVKRGHDVYIITKRFGPHYANYGKGDEHVEVFELADELGIPHHKVYFTDREWKTKIISSLEIEMHFENSENEVIMISKMGGVTVVPVEDPYWRDIIY